MVKVTTTTAALKFNVYFQMRISTKYGTFGTINAINRWSTITCPFIRAIPTTCTFDWDWHAVTFLAQTGVQASRRGGEVLGFPRRESSYGSRWPGTNTVPRTFSNFIDYIEFLAYLVKQKRNIVWWLWHCNITQYINIMWQEISFAAALISDAAISDSAAN